MSLRVFMTAFSTLFLAEMGDKTQLAVLSLTAATKQPWAVWLGASAALMTVTGLGVWLGQGLGRVISPELLRRVGAVMFVVIGLAMLFSKD